MKKTGLLILLAVLAICMVVFTACGGKDQKPDNTTPDETPDDVHTHTFGEWIAEVAATCETEGVKAHKHCDGCNKDFDADGKEILDLVIPELGHNYETIAEVAATCLQDGSKAYQKCARCGKLIDTEDKEIAEADLVIPKLEHTIEDVAEVAATCAKEGNKAHKKCTVCGTLFDAEGNEIAEADVVIAKTEHKYGDLVAEVAADYDKTGMKAHYQCSECKAYFDKDKKEVTKEDLTIPVLTATAGLKLTSNGDGTCSVSLGDCTETDIVIPPKSADGETVTVIAKSAFENCKTMTSIAIPSTIICIDEYAFFGCTSLKSIAIPENVEEIQDYAFSYCPALESLTVDEDNDVYFSKYNCIIHKASRTLVAGCSNSVIPTDGSVTVVGQEAFWGSETLKSIIIPNCLTEIQASAFAGGCNLTISFVGSEEEWKAIVKGEDWDKDATLTIKFVASQGLKFTKNDDDDDENVTCTVEVGDCEDMILIIPAKSSDDKDGMTVTKIAEKAFINRSGITTVIIPNTVTEIGKSAFSGCKNLETIVFQGTQAEWESITLGTDWYKATKVDVDNIIFTVVEN